MFTVRITGQPPELDRSWIASLGSPPKPRVVTLAEWVGEVLGPRVDEPPGPEGSEP